MVEDSAPTPARSSSAERADAPPRVPALALSPEALRDFVLADPLAQRLAAMAAAHGRPIAAVGGCVRDWLLGRAPGDWDLVIPGDPTPLAAELARAARGPLVTLDAEFGVVRTRLSDGLTIDLVRQQGESLEEDLHRRDLTVNALAVDLTTGTLHDPTGGLADLRAGRVRTIRRANLADDPLRLVRVFRFAAGLAMPIEAETLGWVKELAPRIAEPAGERVAAELGKLFASPRFPQLMPDFVRTGLLGALLPELALGEAAAPALAEQAARLNRDLDAAAGGHWGEAGRRGAALLDEPLTSERPRRFLVHLLALLAPHPEAPALAESVCGRWKLGNKELDWLRKALAAREALAGWAGAADPARASYRIWRDAGEAALGAALVGGEEAHGADFWARWWGFEAGRAPRLVGGNDLMKELGLKPGPHLAPLLRDLDEAQALGELTSREEALAWAAQRSAARE